MAQSRAAIAAQTSTKLAVAAPTLASFPALIGFDGFVDEIIAVVDKRHTSQSYDAVKTIGHLGAKISAAAGESSNYELIVKQAKLGGNGPIMANALAAAGMAVTYIGNLGYPALHPAFEELNQRAKVYSIAEPGHTDALEFDDGKLMLGKHQTLGDVNWDNLVSRVGMEELIRLAQQSRIIGMVNWTMLAGLTDIWKKMLSEVFPKIDRAGKFVFADLCDPEKRTRADLRAALDVLSQMQGKVDTILGLNLKEAIQVAEALDIAPFADENEAIRKVAISILEKMRIACVVIHPRRGAAAATAGGESAWFDGPLVKEPKISTGAGDHFNSGFALGRMLGFSLEESLCTGVATSGFYVRNAQSPSASELSEFVATLPAPQ